MFLTETFSKWAYKIKFGRCYGQTKKLDATYTSGECPNQAVLNLDTNWMMCSLKCASPPPNCWFWTPCLWIKNKIDYFTKSLLLSIFHSYIFVTILCEFLLLHMFSFYMLYKFKKNGKRIFVITLAIIVLSDLFGGAYAASSFVIFTSNISLLIEGAMLAMLYVTPISRKF